MPTDIGPRIGIDGEKEFRQNLKQISQQIKTLGTEMKAVTSAFDANDKSQENLAKQADVLNREIALQETRLKEIQRALDYARKNYDENSNEVQRWQQTLNNATTDLNKMRKQLSDVEDELNDTGDESDDASDSIDDVGDSAEDSSSKIDTMTVALGNLIADGIRGAIDGLKNLVSQIWELDDATEDYRKAQGRVNTAFENAGYSAEDGAKAYNEFYKILGDTDTAAEASQLLARLADDQKDLTEWTRIAAGVSGTFGDSLPIEGLIEAANETANVGTVTGVLADALNWVGISEDEFNSKLAECSDTSERNSLIMETLSETYSDAADAFYDNNASLVEARDTQNRLTDSLSDVGEAVSDLKTNLATEFAPVIEDVTGMVADFINNIDTEAIANGIKNAFQWLRDNGSTLISVITGIAGGFLAIKTALVLDKAIQSLKDFSSGMGLVRGAWELLKTSLSAVSPLGLVVTAIGAITTGVITLWNTSEDFRNAVKGILDAIANAFVSAWEWIKQAWSDVKSFFAGIWQGIKDVFNSVKEWFEEKFGAAWGAVKTVFSAVGTFFSDVWTSIKDAFASVSTWFSETFGEAWQGAKDVFNDVTTFFGDVWEDIKEAFSGAWEWFKGVGEDIVNGIWDGIKGLWDDLTDWFSGLWDSLFGKKDIQINATVKQSITTDYQIKPGFDKGRIDGSAASGLDYVPFDGYIAELHKGEMVLTADEAERMRSAVSSAASDFSGLAAGMVNGIQTAMTGAGGHYTVEIPIIINGQEFSRAILPDLRNVMRANPQVVSGV